MEIDPDNPFGASEEDQNPEIINWNHNIDGSSVSVYWDGNEYALEFRYMLETQDYSEPSPYLDWSEWITYNNIYLDHLDEGHYILYLKSRIGSKEDTQGLSIDFDINAVEGCAIRMYPLYQEITHESDFDLFVYIEECPDLMLMDLRLQYNQDELEVNDITAEDIISEKTDLVETMYWGDDGNITIIAGLLNENSIQNYNENGTAAVARIRFHAKSQTTWSQIIIDEGSSKLRNMNYDDIEFHGVSGTVDVIE